MLKASVLQIKKQKESRRNAYENGVIKYQIDLEKYKNGQANEVIAMLDKANNELARYVKQTNGVYTKARYKEIAKKLADVSKKLKQKVESGTDIDGLIDYELKKQKKLLDAVSKDIKPVKGGKFNFLYPTVEQIKTSALFKPVDVKTGMTYETYLNGIENGLYNLWDAQIRTGYLTGMTTDQIVRNVMGGISQEAKITHANAMQSLRNSVYGNTRTVLQSFATETRNRVFERNEEYFGDGETKYKYEYLATLDARTCLVCGDLDGRLYEKIEDAPSLPQHRGCRCLLIPYFAIEGDKRASKDGYLDDKLTYEDWLERQDEETQREVLGTRRYELYKRGVRVEQFIDNGEVIKLSSLAESKEFADKVYYARESDIPIPDEMKRYEKKIFTHSKEHGIVYTEKGDIYLLDGTENSIDYRQLDKSLYKNCIFSHNHPNKSPASHEDILGYNQYEMKAYRTVGFYKGKETVLQFQRDFTKKDKTKDFAQSVEKMEKRVFRHMADIDILYEKGKLKDDKYMKLYFGFIDDMFNFYKKYGKKYNYIITLENV